MEFQHDFGPDVASARLVTTTADGSAGEERIVLNRMDGRRHIPLGHNPGISSLITCLAVPLCVVVDEYGHARTALLLGAREPRAEWRGGSMAVSHEDRPAASGIAGGGLRHRTHGLVDPWPPLAHYQPCLLQTEATWLIGALSRAQPMPTVNEGRDLGG
ncbi:hypothetical protein [Streptomyces sp. NPDC051577]|uniref:hypothetical protein n=1 Tax=Streptomyces sp. NPDC051577 TaxID=3155166 RepID=UPI00343BA877